MKIGELEHKTGLSKDTIRLYERIGLLTDITQPHKTNSYKDYSEKNIFRIDLIKYSQGLGFSLDECKEIIEALENGELTSKKKKLFIDNKLKEIDQKMNELTKFRTLLEEALKKTC